MKEDEKLWVEFFYKNVLKSIEKQKKVEWEQISLHPYIPIQLVKLYPTMPWGWQNISRLSFHKIEELITLFPSKDWDWHHLSISSPLPFIQENPDLKWHYDKISRRKYSFERLDTPLEYALKNLHMPWNWSLLSRHPSMTMDHLFNHNSLPWDLDYIFLHCSFSSYHLSHIAPNNRNFSLLSKNPHNTISILCQHLDKPWDWSGLAQNIAFAPHIVYPYKNTFPLWRWDLSLRNPRLTWSFYNIIRKETTIHKQFHHLLRNHFHGTHSFFSYFMIVIRRFLLNVMNRLLILRKIKLLCALQTKIDKYLLRVILFQYVG